MTKPIDGVSCPRAGCGSGDVVMHYRDVYSFGEREPVQQVKQGAECLTCGLKFWNEEVAGVDEVRGRLR